MATAAEDGTYNIAARLCVRLQETALFLSTAFTIGKLPSSLSTVSLTENESF